VEKKACKYTDFILFEQKSNWFSPLKAHKKHHNRLNLTQMHEKQRMIINSNGMVPDMEGLPVEGMGHLPGFPEKAIIMKMLHYHS